MTVRPAGQFEVGVVFGGKFYRFRYVYFCGRPDRNPIPAFPLFLAEKWFVMAAKNSSGLNEKCSSCSVVNSTGGYGNLTCHLVIRWAIPAAADRQSLPGDVRFVKRQSVKLTLHRTIIVDRKTCGENIWI